MRKKVVEEAKREAKRFLERVEQMEKEARTYDFSEKKNDPYYEPGKLTGAVRRASMDLTRALVAVRRPN